MTSHAIERFREYVMPSSPYGRARSEAIAVSMSSRKTGQRTPVGDEVWEASDGVKVRFVVKRDGGAKVCVTVLMAVGDDGAEEP
jgi:hypothetical protein